MHFKNGIFDTVAGTIFFRTSSWTPVPTLENGVSTYPMDTFFFNEGEGQPLVSSPICVVPDSLYIFVPPEKKRLRLKKKTVWDSYMRQVYLVWFFSNC